jgi:hypothetical protein
MGMFTQRRSRLLRRHVRCFNLFRIYETEHWTCTGNVGLRAEALVCLLLEVTVVRPSAHGPLRVCRNLGPVATEMVDGILAAVTSVI